MYPLNGVNIKQWNRFKVMMKINNYGKRLIAGLSAFSLILTSTVVQAMAETTATSALKGTRLYGSNRYKTAVEISKAGWNSLDYVVLASGESFADELCALCRSACKEIKCSNTIN